MGKIIILRPCSFAGSAFTDASTCAKPVIAINDDGEVTITCATQGAKIYYTTDGSTPSTLSQQYSQPFEVSGTGTITAFTAKEGMYDSLQVSMPYQIQAYTWDDIPAIDNHSSLAGNQAQVNSVSVQKTYMGSSRKYSSVKGVRYKSGALTVGQNIGIYKASTAGVTSLITNHTVTAEEATAQYIEIRFNPVELSATEYIGVQTDGVLYWVSNGPAGTSAMSVSTVSTDLANNTCAFGYALLHN